ncbi:MAG: YjfB family protein [Lachnospiraceae bacterium]|jgi:hypothetical protein|nr:YjfB family protein [Lachnospiraceae bacterium]MBQ1608144.1 YjfB family protein [Lachnospiraceae bacterium]MBQ2318103.1 YjfB family protein [Lachnospiraceae bacterium]MBQ2466803.1 YjfB family protein [Lachnospiraceae bacterium]MBQ2504190.1 YjfB family protein [Lachnospiraceae bacterium]
MDIGLLSMNMSAAQSLGEVGTAIMAKTLHDSKEQAAGEVAMLNSMPPAAMELSVNPNVGSNFDMSV